MRDICEVCRSAQTCFVRYRSQSVYIVRTGTTVVHASRVRAILTKVRSYSCVMLERKDMSLFMDV